MSKMLMKAGKASALNWAAWKDFLINGLIVVISAALSYMVDNIAKLDFGSLTTILVPIIAMILKYIQKWIAEFTKKEVEPEPTPPNGPNFPVR